MMSGDGEKNKKASRKFFKWKMRNTLKVRTNLIFSNILLNFFTTKTFNFNQKKK